MNALYPINESELLSTHIVGAELTGIKSLLFFQLANDLSAKKRQ